MTVVVVVAHFRHFCLVPAHANVDSAASVLLMSYRRRKRSVHRSRPSLAHHDGEQVPENSEQDAAELVQEQDAPSEPPSDAEKTAREQEVWESFREEHYEGM